MIQMKQARRRIALLHHTGCGNLGDDAIIDSVVSNIQRRWKNAEITVFSMNPEDTNRRHGLPCYPIRRFTWSNGDESASVPTETPEKGILNWLKTTRNPAIRLPRAIWGEFVFLLDSYRHVKSFDLLVVSGGGQLTERGGPWSFPYALFVWTLLAKRAGVKSIFLNVGAGPLKHPVSKFFVPRALRAADYVSFRDKQSQELATELGFKGISHVCPDNVYALDIETREESKKDGAGMVVGFAPMPYPFSDLLTPPSNPQAIEDELIGRLAKFASLLVAESYTLKLFGSDVRSDPTAIGELRRDLLNRHHITMPEYVPLNSVEELLARMSEMDYIVTCRFHGVVLAHLLNKPVVAIAHHPKVTHLMDALGLSEYCVDMHTFDPEQLVEKFTRLVGETEIIKKKLKTTWADYRTKASAQFDCLFPSDSIERPEHALDSKSSLSAAAAVR
jgi:polysaccharide pyruvyl transferase WcaK-like protein